jgi:hypothetical protein
MNKEMKALSQMLAQACWERQLLAEKVASFEQRSVEEVRTDVRNTFCKRYMENYL